MPRGRTGSTSFTLKGTLKAIPIYQGPNPRIQIRRKKYRIGGAEKEPTEFYD